MNTMLHSRFAEAFGWMLVHSLWELALIAAVCGSGLWLLRRSAAQVRYVLACVGLLLMVLAPVATDISLLPPPPVAAQGTGEIVAAGAIPHGDRAIERPSGSVTAARVVAPDMKSYLTPWLPVVVAGYVLGAGAMLARLLLGYMRLRALILRGTAIQDRVAAIVGEVARRMGVRRAVRIVQSAAVEVPTLIGALKPVILLPAAALTGLSAEQLTALLAHELAHIRRHDYLANLLQSVLETLLFYHPAVWWLSACVRQERENCCDDAAVAVTGDAAGYARALESMERLRAVDVPAGLMLAARGGRLLPRIRRLLTAPPVRARPLSHALSGVMVLGALGICLYLLGCGPREESVLARAGAGSGKPQILVKVVFANMDDDFLAQQGLRTVTPTQSGDGTWKVAAPLEAIADAIDKKEHGEVISRPMILAENNQEAFLQVGQTVPLLPDGKQQFAGIQLDVVPTLNGEQSLMMPLQFSLSGLAGATTQANGVSVPVVETITGQFQLTMASDTSTMILGPRMPGEEKAGAPPRHVVVLVTPSWKLTAEQRAQLARTMRISYTPATQPGINGDTTRIDLHVDVVKAVDGTLKLPVSTEDGGMAMRLVQADRQALMKQLDGAADADELTTPNFTTLCDAEADVFVGWDSRTRKDAAGASFPSGYYDGSVLEIVPTLSADKRQATLKFLVIDNRLMGPGTAPAGGRTEALKENGPQVASSNFEASLTLEQGQSVLLVGPARVDEGKGKPAHLYYLVTPAWPARGMTRVIAPAARTDMTTRYQQLMHHDASDVAGLVNLTFAPKDGKLGATPVPVHASFDKRTNTIFVTGEPKQVDAAMEMVRKLEDEKVDTTQAIDGMPPLKLEAVPAATTKAAATQPAEFYIFGAVARPGVYSGKLTLKQLVTAAAGGLDGESIKNLQIKLIRRAGASETTTLIHVDALFNGSEPDQTLQPNDVVQVEKITDAASTASGPASASEPKAKSTPP